jgi:hypothetical protein
MKLKLAIGLLLISFVVGCAPQDAVYVHQPVTVAGNVTASVPNPMTVTGTVAATVTNPLPVTGTVTVTNTVTVAGGVTATISPNPMPVTGTVGVTGTVTANSAITQNVVADANNSSVANVNSGITWSGAASSTLGVAAIQVSLKTDQNCTVYVDQSPDNAPAAGAPHWDITDTYNYISSLGGNSWTVQAVNSYVRVRVKNVGTANTTYFRLQTALCPIVDAVPRSLNPAGRLMTDGTIIDAYGFQAEMTPFGEVRIAETVKLAGAPFSGTLDASLWQTSLANGGTAAVPASSATTGGDVVIATNVTANGTAVLSSFRRARFVAGASNFYKSVIRLPDTGVANNLRRWGITDWASIATITDGAYFYLDGTTFGVGTMRGGTPALVPSGTFNGVYGTVYTPGTIEHVYEIYYSPYAVYFTVDGKLLHTLLATAAPWSNTPHFYIWFGNVNSSGATTNCEIHCRAASISRLGPLESATIYRHISGAAATYVCKVTPGTFHSLVINNPADCTVTIYDNTAGSGTVIALIDLNKVVSPLTLVYNTDFFIGLTVVVSKSTPDLTVVFE